MQSLTRYLEGRLKLKLNRAKSKVAKMSACGFLGFTIIRGKCVFAVELALGQSGATWDILIKQQELSLYYWR